MGQYDRERLYGPAMTQAAAAAMALEQAPSLVAGLSRACWLAPTGEAARLPHEEAARRAAASPPLVCHAAALARRLGVRPFAAYDLLELHAFVRPTRFCLPTPRGLARAMGLAPPEGLEAEAAALGAAAAALLAELAAWERPAKDAAAPVAASMAGWPWGPMVLAALGRAELAAAARNAPAGGGLAVWRRLPKWSELAPEPPPGNAPVEPAAARARLAELLGPGAENRPQQADFASAVTAAFAPRTQKGAPNMVLAEAGTGTGKTLGYIAPASLWAEQNGAAVWISTYTRNLQQQIDGELDRLHPDPELKAAKVVIRKGRENYLCLLNLEEAVGRLGALMPREAVALGLMARWVASTRDGDLGGDFPAWLAGLFGAGLTLGLADRRGECIYSACPHYDRCFIERSVRRARRADIVVANHALVMIQAALGGMDDTRLPTRYVFDEGHHLFDAADNVFASRLTGQETAELRRWLLGAEGRRAGRARGLAERVGDLLGDDRAARETYDQVLAAARALPAAGWRNRVGDGAPQGPAEAFFRAVREQVYARAHTADSPYSLQTEVRPLGPEVAESAAALEGALGRLVGPMTRLKERLTARLEDEAEELDTPTRVRIEAVCRGLQRRGDAGAEGWRAMLAELGAEAAETVDWFEVERAEGRDLDVGMVRHWRDPTLPFAEAVAARAHGLVVTSATLTDASGDVEADWRAAEGRTGSRHLPLPAIRARVASPYDYGALTRAVVVTDVRRDDPAQVAAAYRALFQAAGGGALGLFTAIARLRQVHARIAAPLEEAGLSLYAQHVDGLDVATLIDIFRAEEDACLLGTDAVRDGVDVPGRSLRLIVFDRVPWPRPSILHRARRATLGGARYDDMLTRLKLAQAYGRLVRRADDRGAFVLLDGAMPSRLAGAFPEGVALRRLGLADAVRLVGEFLGEA